MAGDAPTVAYRWVNTGSIDMLDVVFVVGGLAFFAVSVGYTLFCERL